MTKISEMPVVGRDFISNLKLPSFEKWLGQTQPCQQKTSINCINRRNFKRNDRPFSWLAKDHRVIHKTDRDLVMTHVAVEFDRSAWQQDLNVIFPLDRLAEMEADHEIGSLADEHYSFMGAADPVTMEKSAREVATRIQKDEGVDTVFLIPI